MPRPPKPDPDASCPVTRGEVDLAIYAARDGDWVALRIPAPARRALVNAGLLSLADLATITRRDLAALHGMGPKAMTMLTEPMAKAGVTFLDAPSRSG